MCHTPDRRTHTTTPLSLSTTKRARAAPFPSHILSFPPLSPPLPSALSLRKSQRQPRFTMGGSCVGSAVEAVWLLFSQKLQLTTCVAMWRHLTLFVFFPTH